MARKSRVGSRTSQKRSSRPAPSPIPEPLQIVSASTVTAGAAKIKVPTLVLRGEWLKAIGFPIGSALYLTTDQRGEMTLHRLGLGLPRRLRIVATSR
jgi:hypothetical protein